MTWVMGCQGTERPDGQQVTSGDAEVAGQELKWGRSSDLGSRVFSGGRGGQETGG